MNETVFIELMRLICAKYDDLNEFVPWHIMHSVQMHLSGSNYDVINQNDIFSTAEYIIFMHLDIFNI